jgi:hypothetical protein
MDEEMLKLIAAKTGLGLKFVIKDEKISMLITQLSKLLDKRFVLKGGTAINRLYLEQKRFSEDLDFDFISKKSVKEKISETKKIMNKIQNFNIAKPRKMNQTIRYDCFYRNGEKDKIRIEFNIALKRKLCEAEKKIIGSHIVPVAGKQLFVYPLEELIAMKIIALLNREDGKDIFDLFFSLDKRYNKKLLHALLKKHGFNKQTKEKLLMKLDEMEKNISYIKNSANHYIPVLFRPDWLSMLRELKNKLSGVL